MGMNASGVVWAVVAAVGGAEEQVFVFDGPQVNEVILSGRSNTWKPKPPGIPVGVVTGGSREVFRAFLAVETSSEALTADFKPGRFTLRASRAAEGRVFKGSVTYEVQVEVFQRFRRWRPEGPPTTRTAELVITVAQSEPRELVVGVNHANDIDMAGEARAVDVKPKQSAVADFRLEPARKPSVLGRKVGKARFDLKYSLGGRTLTLPLEVTVVDKELILPLALREAETEPIVLEGLEGTAPFTDWKLKELLYVKHPDLLTAKARKGALTLTGHSTGATRVAAVYSAKEGSRTIAVKVKFEVRIEKDQAP